MIAVSVKKGRIEIDGHAGYGRRGEDIVCAAVSALAYTLAESLENLTDDSVKYSLTPGRAFIECQNLSDAGRLITESFLVGIKLIAGSYPEFIYIDQA